MVGRVAIIGTVLGGLFGIIVGGFLGGFIAPVWGFYRRRRYRNG